MNHLKKFNETFFWNKKKKDKEPEEEIDLNKKIENKDDIEPARYRSSQTDKYLGQLDEFDLYVSRDKLMARYGDGFYDFVSCPIEEEPSNYALQNAKDRAIELGYIKDDSIEDEKDDKYQKYIINKYDKDKDIVFSDMTQSELRRYLRNDFVASVENMQNLVKHTKDFTEKEMLAVAVSLGKSGKMYCSMMKKKYKKNIKL